MDGKMQEKNEPHTVTTTSTGGNYVYVKMPHYQTAWASLRKWLEMAVETGAWSEERTAGYQATLDYMTWLMQPPAEGER